MADVSNTPTNLPDEIWELIFSFFDQPQQWEATSLVSRRFLTITNHLKLRLTIIFPTTLVLPRILQRFRNLKTIDAREFEGDLDGLVDLISRSGLDIEELNLSKQNNLPVRSFCRLGRNLMSLKVLKCSRLGHLEDRDLAAIASSLPMLEELDICYPENAHDSMDEWGFMSRIRGKVTDAGIEELSSKLLFLTKINVSGNHFISDRSLIVLSSNCILLREIVAKDCCFITQNGIGFVMRNCANLVSFSVHGMELVSPPPPLPHPPVTIMNSISYAKALSVLELSYSSVSDQFLCSLANENFPLRKISFSNCYSFTFAGVFCLLQAYRSLNSLSLERVDFLTDKCISEISKFLHNVVCISLRFCTQLSNSTFFTLSKDCPSLDCIQMERTCLGCGDFPMNFEHNPRIKTLRLGRNCNLKDEGILRIASVCPNLRLLDISRCTGITEMGIAGVLKTCRGLRSLTLSQCGKIKGLGINCGVCKIEVLELEDSAIDDLSLAMIAKRCNGLLHLDLQGCLNISDAGLKEVVMNCTRLRTVNLSRCHHLNLGILTWMVLSRPSLRKITLPCGFITSESLVLFLRHGCYVCKSKV